MLEASEGRPVPEDRQADSLWSPEIEDPGNRDRPHDAAIALAIVDDAAAVLFACVMSTRLTGDGATAPPSGAVFFVLAVWMLLVGVGGLNTLEHLPLATTGRRILTVTIIALNVFI